MVAMYALLGLWCLPVFTVLAHPDHIELDTHENVFQHIYNFYTVDQLIEKAPSVLEESVESKPTTLVTLNTTLSTNQSDVGHQNNFQSSNLKAFSSKDSTDISTSLRTSNLLYSVPNVKNTRFKTLKSATKFLSTVHFNCSGRSEGYYADVEHQCRVFHYCKRNGIKFTFVCPNDSLFDQQEMTCETNARTTQTCRASEDFYYLNTWIYHGGKNQYSLHNNKTNIYSVYPQLNSSKNNKLNKSKLSKTRQRTKPHQSRPHQNNTRVEHHEELTMQPSSMDWMRPTMSSTIMPPPMQQIDTPRWFQEFTSNDMTQTLDQPSVSVNIYNRVNLLEITTKKPDQTINVKISKPRGRIKKPKTTPPPSIPIDWDDERGDVHLTHSKHKLQHNSITEKPSDSSNDYLYGKPLELPTESMHEFSPVSFESIISKIPSVPPMLQLPIQSFDHIASTLPPSARPTVKPKSKSKGNLLFKLPFTPLSLLGGVSGASIGRRWVTKRKPWVLSRVASPHHEEEIDRQFEHMRRHQPLTHFEHLKHFESAYFHPYPTGDWISQAFQRWK